MKKYNLSEIMHKAWKLYRKGVGSFAEALHRAWNSAKAATPFRYSCHARVMIWERSYFFMVKTSALLCGAILL